MSTVDTLRLFEENDKNVFLEAAGKCRCFFGTERLWRKMFDFCKSVKNLPDDDYEKIEELRLLWEEEVESWVSVGGIEAFKRCLYLIFWTATNPRSVASPFDPGFGVIFDALFQVCRRHNLTF